MTTSPVLQLLADRKASRALDPSPHPAELVAELVEAVRLTPSCRNNQPWRLTLLESPAARDAGAAALAPGNQVWAARAAVLAVLSARPADDCLTPGGLAYVGFDVGAASLALMLAATARGLVARPMAGFDADALRQAAGLAPEQEPWVVIALARPAADESFLPEGLRQLDDKPRQRKPTAEILARR